MNRDRDTTERSKQKLISMGKAKGYVTYDEVNDAMPEEIVSSDQIDDWLSSLGDEGIEVVDAGQGAATAVKVPARTAVVPKVPEVIEDFFVQAGPLAGVHPKETRANSHVFKMGKIPRTLL